MSEKKGKFTTAPTEAKDEARSQSVMSTKLESVQVGVDCKVEDVLQWDSEGRDLKFEEGEGRFLQLSPDQVRQLSSENKVKYLLAENQHAYDVSQKDEPEAAPLRVSMRLAPAGRRMHVEYPEGYRDKWHTCWKRPDEMMMAEYDGYEIVKSEEVKTPGGSKRPGGMHVIGVAGEDEQVLMKKPKKQHDAEMAERKRARRERVDGFDRKMMEEMRNMNVGGHPGAPFDGGGDDKNWRNIRGDNG